MVDLVTTDGAVSTMRLVKCIFKDLLAPPRRWGAPVYPMKSVFLFHWGSAHTIFNNNSTLIASQYADWADEH